MAKFDEKSSTTLRVGSITISGLKLTRVKFRRYFTVYLIRIEIVVFTYSRFEDCAFQIVRARNTQRKPIRRFCPWLLFCGTLTVKIINGIPRTIGGEKRNENY